MSKYQFTVVIVFLLAIFISACARITGVGSENRTPEATEPPAPNQPADEGAQPESSVRVLESRATIAFIDPDGNIQVLYLPANALTPITTDATPVQPENPGLGPLVRYSNLKISPDGTLLAFQREAAAQDGARLEYQFSVLISDLLTGEIITILDKPTAGYAWRPGTLLLTYALPAAGDYFLPDGKVDSDKASGIWGYDLVKGEHSELFPAPRGLTLVNPTWSGDGNFLGFEEIEQMEGHGKFGFYNFASGESTTWDEAIGGYSWSPDGSFLTYDRLVYVPTGQERIWLQESSGGEEQLVTDDLEKGFAFNPIISPAGDQVAYLVNTSLEPGALSTLFVRNLADGEARSPSTGSGRSPSTGSGRSPSTGSGRSLGVFDQPQGMNWSSDGRRIYLSAGTGARQLVYEVNLRRMDPIPLLPGSQPSVGAPVLNLMK